MWIKNINRYHEHKTGKVQEKSSMNWPNGHKVFKRLAVGFRRWRTRLRKNLKITFIK